MSAAVLDAVAIPLPALAEKMLSEFQPGMLRLAARAGVERAELPGIAVVVTADAVEGFDPARGKFAARWWTKCQNHFFDLSGAGVASVGAAGDLPVAAGAIEADADEGALAALAAIGLVAAAERESGRTATSRRRLERLRAEAAALLDPNRRQGELFGGGAT